MTRPLVLLYEPIHPDAVARLEEHCAIRYASSLEPEVLQSECSDADAIIIRANGKVTRAIIEHAPRLRVVARHGVGVENIDLAAARERGVVVVNTPDANTRSVAEHCIGMMLNLAKHSLAADRATRQARWDARYQLTGIELGGKTLGLVGFGRIGQRVATLARHAFEMSILYHDAVAYPEAERALNARRASLHELLSLADFVSLHVPLLPSTRHLIGAREFASMRPSAFIINTSRGAVVDESALVAALQGGRIAGAGLDVFENEPVTADNPLLQLENVVLSPHMASHTHEALYRMAMVVEDVLAVLQGRAPRHPVTSG